MKAYIALCLSAMAALMWDSAAAESQTYDEAVHLFSGYAYLTEGDFRWNPEHPPLSKLIQAAPLLRLKPPLPKDSEHWRTANGAEASRLFVHSNTIPNAKVLAYGRAATILMTIALGLALAVFVSRFAGFISVMLGLGLFALDSNFLAHGHYITSDVPVTLGIFLAAITWLRYIETGKRRDLAWSALALGAAVATKYSALYLIPVHLAAALVLAPKWINLRRYALVLIAALAVAAATYGNTSIRAFLVNPRKPLATLRDNHPYATGVKAVYEHNEYKQFAYLNGEVYHGGKWQYFPIAFLVKTPAASLLAFLLAVVLAARQLIRRNVSRYWLAFLLYPAAYFGMAMAGDINIGVRHILPIYPFLYAAAAVAIAQLPEWRTRLILSLGALALYETLTIHPSHIAAFNLFAGGPDNGPNLLVDSNLDWGQDLAALSEFLKTHRGNDQFVLAYFGSADPADYGIKNVGGLPATWMTEGIASLDAWAAVSITVLQGDYFDKPAYDWLKSKKPYARIGRSILVYDLRKKR